MPSTHLTDCYDESLRAAQNCGSIGSGVVVQCHRQMAEVVDDVFGCSHEAA